MQMPVRNGFSMARLGARAMLWILASSLGGCAVAQDAPDAADDTDTPDEIAPERVARLSFMQGGVSLQGVGETVWAPATLNRPITPGDFLRTEMDGRAEVQVGAADVRLGAGSSFGFSALNDDAMRMRLSVGVLNLRVRTLGENETIEIETPQATASILRSGSYRLEVNPDGSATVVKVSSGMLEARGFENQNLVVRAQQVATLTGKGRFAYTTATLGPPDAFDTWALERDRREDYVLSTEPARNVPAQDIVGYEDLESYGTWSSETDYGYVWTPTYVSAGWSPYRFGRYTYVSGWGWAWIDDSPWGFAPYHYGRWVTIGNRWSWVPGPRHGRPIGRPIGTGGTVVVGRPSPEHGWHVPRPPRGGVTVQNHAGRFGTRVESNTPSGVQPSVVEQNRARMDDGRLRTPRYEVPRNPRADSRGGSYTPQPRPATPPPQQQQQQQQQRPVMTSPRPSVSQPAASPRPAPAASPRPAPSGGDARPTGPRPRATQER